MQPSVTSPVNTFLMSGEGNLVVVSQKLLEEEVNKRAGGLKHRAKYIELCSSQVFLKYVFPETDGSTSGNGCNVGPSESFPSFHPLNRSRSVYALA